MTQANPRRHAWLELIKGRIVSKWKIFHAIQSRAIPCLNSFWHWNSLSNVKSCSNTAINYLVDFFLVSWQQLAACEQSATRKPELSWFTPNRKITFHLNQRFSNFFISRTPKLFISCGPPKTSNKTTDGLHMNEMPKSFILVNICTLVS